MTVTHRHAFADLGFTDLFADYTADFPALAGYYAGDFRHPEARQAAADRTAAFDRNRDALADLLLEQNESWGLDDATRAHIDALRDPETVAVVTGQQLGLFASPLYIPYKTITTIHLARQIAEETGRTVVPVFWLEGNDHDFDEIATFRLLQGQQLVPLTYTGHTLPDAGNLGSVGRLRLTEQITEVLDEIDGLLPPTDFKPGLMALLRDAYQPDATLLDAFAHVLRALFPDAGLVFIAPDDPRIRALATPLFRQEIEDSATPAARVQAASEKLEKDYHAQVHARPTNLFLNEPEGRLPLDAEADGTFRVRGTDRAFSQKELLTLLDDEPGRFTPNVILRPVTQDFLLPTVAYVGGPGEVAYFAQYRGVYDWAGVPMPLLYPRTSVSLVEPPIAKVLDRYGLPLPALNDELDRLFRRVVLDQMEVDLPAAFQEASTNLHAAINAIKPVVEGVDRSLVRTAEATRASFMKEWSRLQDRVVKAERQQQEVVRNHLAKAQAHLFPSGLQERAISPIYFLNKYGLDLFARLTELLPLDTTAHTEVRL